jgi:hypothetical protein
VYCYNCGKELSEDANFCFQCGRQQKEIVQPITGIQQYDQSKIWYPPVALEIVHFSAQGPKEVKSRFKGTEMRRGFRFDFALSDVGGHRTCSDGKLYIVLYNESRTLASDVNTAVREVMSRNDDNRYSLSIEVRYSEFRWLDWNNKFGKTWKDLTYTYSQTTPLVPFLVGAYFRHIYLHLWFVTPDGRCLYDEEFTSWDA